MRRNRGARWPDEVVLTHKVPLRVRFSEVDSMQIVWHGEYVRYFEDGREAFGRHYVGIGYMDIYRSGYTAPVVDLQVHYVRPLAVGDTATVEVRYLDSAAAKICFEYEIRRNCDGAVAATGRSVQVFVDAQGALSLTLPDFYRQWRERWLNR